MLASQDNQQTLFGLISVDWSSHLAVQVPDF
jgi:hypothetical protein